MASELTTTFDQCRADAKAEELETLRQNYYIQASMRGSDEASVGGIQVNQAGRKDTQSIESKKRRKASDDMIFMALLDQMREQLADLEANMAELRGELTEKYGEDFIGGMAASYLSEDELAGCETDEDKLNALADKFLDDDGNIKEEYKHLAEAQYVRDWQKSEQLKPVIAKYEDRNTLEPEEKHEIYQMAKTLPNVDAENMRQASTNRAVKEVVTQAVDEAISTEEKSYSNFSIPVVS